MAIAKQPTTTSQVLKSVRLPSTLDWMFRQGTLKSPNAKRLAMIGIDHWNGRQPVPAVRPPAKSKGVVLYDRASVASWSFGGAAAAGGVAAANVATVVPVLPVVGGSALLALASMTAVWNYSADARKYRAQVRAAKEDHARRNRTNASTVELVPLKVAATTDEGKLVLATVLAAADIADSPAWTSDLLDLHHGRIDLELHVAEIAYSGGEIKRLRDAMAPPPNPHVVADPDVRRIVKQNEEHLADRLESLAVRVRALLDYHDGIRTLEPLVVKRSWIENQPDAAFTVSAADELAASDLSRATDDINSGTRAAVEYLVEQAKRSRLLR